MEVREIIAVERLAIEGIPLDNPYKKVLRLIHSSQKKSGRLIVSGVGKAGDVGRKIVSTFNSTGINAFFLSPLDAAHGDLGALHKNDVLFLISNSGKTREVLELTKLARKLYPRIETVGLTGSTKSPLAKEVDEVLFTGAPKEACPLGLTPTSSAIAMLVIADILTILSIEERNFTVEQYRLRHHGGYLGKKARKIFSGKNID